MTEKPPRQRPLRKKILRNKYVVSFRNIATGKVRSMRCCQFNILPDEHKGMTWYAVGWKDGNDKTRRLTEWLDSRQWRLVTPEERYEHYIKKEETRVEDALKKLETKRKRRGTPEEQAEKRRIRLEKLKAYSKEWRAKKKAEQAAAAPPEESKPRITFAEEEQPADPDKLTPAEEAALSDAPKKAASAGDINKEMPNEYNAAYHLKNDKHPFGAPDKLAMFDALVTSEATMREAKVRIEQARARRTINEVIEKTGSGWTSG